MKVIYDEDNQKVPIFSWCENVEQSAMAQALMLANHPCVFHHVSLMPDTHTGQGMPIGGVVALEGAISPNMVGVDIGCGMCALPTGQPRSAVQGKLSHILKQVAFDVPVGFKHRDVKKVTPSSEKCVQKLHEKYDAKTFWKIAPVNIDQNVREQIGTLGGGNHFIEIQVDEEDKVWIMIHSGSRNIGKTICDHFYRLAKKRNEQWKTALSDKMQSLSFFPFDSQDGRDYFDAMNFALDFAMHNRWCMMELVYATFERQGLTLPKMTNLINIHHNYAAIEHHYKKNVIVHRKGATLATSKTKGVIPGSMGTPSYIVQGLGQPKSFHSCSHGAGRTMSRKAAKSTIRMSDFKKAMRGIEFDVTNDHLDEAPQAYKDIDKVMAQQGDLVRIVTKLKPIAVMKG